MQISKKTMCFISKPSKKYVIPFFQRAYVWEEEEWKNLLVTLLESEDNNHFLGTMIFKEDKNSGKSQGLTTYNIIDGQQRLTTMMLLLKVCEEKLSDAKYEKIIKRINKTLYYYDDIDDEPNNNSEIKLEHSLIDADIFKKVIKGKDLTEEEKTSKIYKCYEYFKDESPNEDKIVVDEKNAHKIIDIILKDDADLDKSYDSLDYLFITIDLTPKESEQTIFNTINSQGVKLTSSDKIKNLIYSIFKENKDKTKEYFNKTWGYIFEKDQTTVKFWNKNVGTGVQAKTNIDLVLQYVAINLGIYTPDKKDSKLEKLSNYYDDYIRVHSNEKSIKQIINIIMKYALIYRELFEKVDVITSYDDINKRIAHIVYYSGAMTICPYLLKIYYDSSKIKDDDYNSISYDLPSNSKLEKKLKQLESLIVRYILISDNNSKIKNFNKKVAPIMRDYKTDDNFIKKMIKDDKGNDAKIDDKYLHSGVSYIKNNKYARLVLYWLTMYKDRMKKNKAMSQLTFDCSLEHVLPQNYTKNYPLNKYPVFKSKNNYYDEEEGKEIREKAIYSIGNMTICRAAANSAYSDAYIKDKIDGKINTKQGSKYTDNEFIELTKKIIDMYKNNKKKRKKNEALWDERDIRIREKEIYKDIINIWPDPLKMNKNKK